MEKLFRNSVILVLSAAAVFLAFRESAWTKEVAMQQALEEIVAEETEEMETEETETEETETEETALLSDSGEEIFTCGDYQYKLSSSGTAVITKYSGKETSISIPAVLDGAAVTSIASRAFSFLRVTDIVIPETVRTIEADSFYYMYTINRVHIKGKATLIADRAFYTSNVTFVCSSDSKAYLYAKEHNIKIRPTDGKDLAAAKITLAQNKVVQNDGYVKIPLTVTFNGKILQEGVDYTCTWSSQRQVGTKTITITAVDYNENNYFGSVLASYDVIPHGTEDLRATKNITTSSIQLKWGKADGVSGYYLYRRKGSSGKYEKIRTFSGAHIVTYKDQGLEKDTGYQYQIVAYQEADGKIYCSEPTKLTVYTDSGKKAVSSSKKVKMKTKKIKLKAKVMTENYEGNWAQPSAISDFFDSKGRYTIAYCDKKYVYIHILDNDKLKITKTIKIKKKYELVGSVTGGPDGNYYIVWGQNSWKSGRVVLSVAKYNPNVKLLKSCDSYNNGD